jgi:ubiquitin-conjugating enzyme E2 Z
MAALPKRLPREIQDAMSADMKAAGIYYRHDELDMRKGRAMIIGPEGTPYANCPLLFSLECPSDYPFSSPSVSFLTTDATTRFHPNLYVGGKVCLSILGTWQGPKWAAVMTISTVLSSIQSLLEPNPMTNEPGWEKYTLVDKRVKDYADFVKYRLTALSYHLLSQWKKGHTPHDFTFFEDVLEEHGDKLIEKLATTICQEAEKDEVSYANIPYGMSGKTEWKRLASIVKLDAKDTLKAS